MWSELRTIVGVGLLCCIVVLVISPFGDLPLTTLRAKQTALLALAALALCWQSVSMAAVMTPSRGPGGSPPTSSMPEREHSQQSCVILC
jgi:hypothetical protein